MNDILMTWLEKTGQDKEFGMFLDLYRNIERTRFAVIKVSGQTLENHMDVIAADIAFLNKLDLYPVVVHGAGTELDRRLPDSKKLNGLRITPPEDMAVIEEVFEKISQELCDKITACGGRAMQVADVFACQPKEGYGRVGDVTGVDTTEVEGATALGFTPIVSPLGKEGEHYYNINADTAAKELVKRLGSRKFILLTETGGVLDENKKVIPFMNLGTLQDYPGISGGMLLKVNEIRDFLQEVKDCAVVITDAENLLKEMFTVKGKGTFLKYHEIVSTKDVDAVDKPKVRALLEDAFKKKLVPHYFETGLGEIIYQKDYEGLIVMKKLNGYDYLDKFAVGNLYQGTGLGTSLWSEVVRKYGGFMWRAAADNPCNSFYADECDGMIKAGRWTIYWIKMDEEKVVPQIDALVNLEETFHRREAI